MDGSNVRFEVDVEEGIVPVTKVSTELTSILRQSKDKQEPILITQNGYPVGVLMDTRLFTEMRNLARQQSDPPASSTRGVLLEDLPDPDPKPKSAK